jgi:serine protease inhibitor
MRATVGVAVLVVACVSGGKLWYHQAAREDTSDAGANDAAATKRSAPAGDWDELAKSNHVLAAGLYARVRDASPPDQNLLVDTGAAFATLATMLAGEKGEAEADLRKALALQLDREALEEALGKLGARWKTNRNQPEGAFLGLEIEEGDKGAVRVKSVVPGGAAAGAGFQAGDRILSIRLSDAPGDTVPVRSAADFVNAMDEAGTVVRIRCQPAKGDEAVTRRLRPAAKLTGARHQQIRNGSILWHTSDGGPPGSFLEFAREARDVSTRPVEFADAARTRDAMQTWFDRWSGKDRTEPLTENALGPRLRVAFTDATIFQPAWSGAARVGALEEIPFALGKRHGRLPALPLSGRFRVSADPDLRVVEVPCVAGLAVVFVQPVKADGLAAAEKRLTPSGLEDLLNAGGVRETKVLVPLFDLVTLRDLRGPLAKLGLAGSFPSSLGGPKESGEKKSPDAATKPGAGEGDKDKDKGKNQVGEQKPNGRLGPATVLQQVAVQVAPPEAVEGSESAPASPAGERIVLERAFLFLVYDRRTGEILIVGRLFNPRAG